MSIRPPKSLHTYTLSLSMANKTSCLYFLFVFAFMYAPLQQSHSGCPLGTQKTHSRRCKVNPTHFTEQLLSNNFPVIETIQINHFLTFLGHLWTFQFCFAYHGRQNIWFCCIHDSLRFIHDSHRCIYDSRRCGIYINVFCAFHCRECFWLDRLRSFAFFWWING